MNKAAQWRWGTKEIRFARPYVDGLWMTWGRGVQSGGAGRRALFLLRILWQLKGLHVDVLQAIPTCIE
jgi:hypothetical protein